MAGNQFSAELLISTTKANKDMQALTGQVGVLDKSLAGLNKTLQSSQGNLDKAVSSISKLVQASRQAASASNESAKAKLAEAKAQAELAKTENANNIAQARVERERSAVAVNNSAVAYRNARTDAVEFANAQRAVKSSTDQMGNSLSNQRYLLYDVGATYRTLGLAASALPPAAIVAATAYEKSFAQVMRVTGETSLTSQELRGELKKLATEIPLSFAELSNIAQIGGQMNVATEDLGRFTETVAKFVATADGATIDSSTQAFGRLANLFNTDLNGKSIDPDFFERIGSAISKTADTSVTSEAKIISMLDKIAPIAAQAGLAAEQVIALGSAMSSVGLAPEISSGFLTRFFGQMNKDVAKGGDAIEGYNKVLGTTSDEFMKLYQNDPSELLRRLVESMSKMGKIEQTTALGELGIKATRDQRVVQALAGSYDVLADAMENSNEAYIKGSYLDQSSQGIFNTLSANLTKLGNAFMNLGDAAGGSVLQILSEFVSLLTVWTQKLTELANVNPVVKGVIATLMTLGSVVGIMFALRSASAFFTAGMVTLTHVTKQATGGTMTFGSQVKALAAAQLQAKGMTEAASVAYVKQVGALRALGAAAGMTRTQAATMSATLETSGVAAGRFGTGMRGAASAVMGFVGGPIGLAITALGFLGSAWLKASADAQRSAEEMARAAEMGGDALAKHLAADFGEGAGIGDGFFNVGKTWQELADSIGVSVEEIGVKLEGGADSIDGYIKELQRLKDERNAQRSGFIDRETNAEVAAYGALIDKLSGVRDEMRKSTDEAAMADRIQKGLKDTVDETGMAFGGASEEVKNWTQELNNAIEAAFGLTNAQGALNAALESLGAGLQKSGTIGTGSADARSNLADFQKVLVAQSALLQQSVEQGEISAQQAAMQFQQYAQGLLGELSNMGVDTAGLIQDTENAIANVQDRFAEQGGGLEMPITVNGDQAIMETDAVLSWMNDYLRANPQVAEVGMQGDDEVAARVFSLVSYISEATNMPFDAVVRAITSPAGEETENVTKFMMQAVNQDFMAYINADTSAAVNNVQAFAMYTTQQLLEINAALSQATAVGNALAGPVGGIVMGAMSTAKILATPAQTIKTANQAAIPSFAPLNKGYKDAAKNADRMGKSAGGAGKKAKKANEDTAKGAKKAGDAVKAQKKDWDELEQQISGYASRVGTAFGYVTASNTGVAEAKDEYYSVLNGIKERLEAQKQQVKDLRAENKALNAERRVQLNDAAKLEKMAGYADQMGNSERAKYYRDEAKALKASAEETKLKVNANEKEAKSIEKGMGNLKGYSAEAIANRKELRSLRDASLKVAEAYAASGASAKTVASETAKWTDKAKAHSKQLGYNASDVKTVTGNTKSYVDILKKVPKTVSTDLKASNKTKSGVDAAKKSISSVPSSKTSTIKAKGSGISAVNRDLNGASKNRTSTISAKFDSATKKRFRQLSIMYNAQGNFILGGTYLSLSMMNRGGLVGRDGMMKFNRGGLVPGTPPSDPRKDNIMASLDGNSMAMIRSGEYIQSQPAVDYYGTGLMDKLNKMEIPRYALGGAVGNTRSNSGNMPSVVELGAESIQSIVRAVQKDVNLYVDSQLLARSVQKGFDAITQQGGSI